MEHNRRDLSIVEAGLIPEDLKNKSKATQSEEFIGDGVHSNENERPIEPPIPENQTD